MTNSTLKTIDLYDVDCQLVETNYQDGNLAVQLVIANTERNVATNELPGTPYCMLSINIPEVSIPESSFAVKNYSESEGIFEACIAAGLIKDTGIRISSGHLTDIPVAQLME